MKLYNLARMTSATTGTGTLTLGVAVSGYLTFSGAGVSDGDVVLYGIKDGSASEVGWGTYTASGTTLSRNVYKSTSSNALINCDGSQEVYITALAGDGGDLLHGTSNPMLGFDMPLNLQLNAGNNGTKLTIAVKGNNGSDPSTTNPVLIPFRDATLANGGPVWIALTAALSIDTHATGATLGTANGVPFRLWVVAVNKAGTVELALWQSVTGGGSPTAVAALYDGMLVNTTNIGATATAASTFYNESGNSGSSNAAIRILGYVDYASGLTTAGTYASNPTTVQLFGPAIKKPGDIVQAVYATATSATSVSTTAFATSFSASITPTSAPNIIRASSTGCVLPVVGLDAGSIAIARGTNTPFASHAARNSTGSAVAIPGGVRGWDAPGTTSSTTYNVRVRGDGTNAIQYPAVSGAGGSAPDNGTLEITEIMV